MEAIEPNYIHNKINLQNLPIDNKLAIDYYNKDNPFTKVIIGSSLGMIGSYSTTFIALGISGAYFSGGIFFYDTAFLVAGWSSLLGTACLVLGIPALIGGIGYSVFKFAKNIILNNYINKIKDQNDDSMIEERKILSLLTNECIKYFKNYISIPFENDKDQIKKDTNEIIQKFRQVVFDESYNDKKDKLKKEINDINFINILLIGNTGVGKSTLINEFLKLKNNKAEEGHSANPMKIENWPKKYPILKNDTDMKGINLYDTEGIVKYGETDYQKHLDKVTNFIYSIDTELKEKINCIWYCISSNRLDGDENYINKILDLFLELKIPIIFVYTKAFRDKDEEIDSIINGLKNFEYFKKNPDDFVFVEVIAKDKYSKRTNELLEKKKGLNTLFEKTKNLLERTIMVPIIKLISDTFNKSSFEIIKKLSSKFQKQYDDIIVKHDKIETFKEKLYDIFQCIYGGAIHNIKRLIEKKIRKWMELLENLNKGELKNILESYNENYLLSKFEFEIKKYYDEKIEKNDNLPNDRKYKKSFKDFKEDIEDYIVNQINSSKEIYALYSLFDMARDLILGEIVKDLENNLNNQKIKMTNELNNDIIRKIQDIESILNK